MKYVYKMFICTKYNTECYIKIIGCIVLSKVLESLVYADVKLTRVVSLCTLFNKKPYFVKIHDKKEIRDI